MIGIVVEGKSADEHFPNKIFYRFSGKSVLEFVIENALRCEYAQKVIVSMPSSDKSLINGNSFKDAVVNISLNKLGRRPFFHYSDEKEMIDRVYFAALEHGLDYVVLLSAENPLIPTWLYSKMIFEFCKNPNSYLSNEIDMPQGLRVQIIPFWILAHIKLFCSDKANLREFIIKENLPISTVSSYLDQLVTVSDDIELSLKNKDQIAKFDYIITELELGVDLEDLIKEMSDA